MDENFKIVKEKIYDACGLCVRNFEIEPESTEYNASRYILNGLTIICRSSKITPKKAGQFVTFWKRNENGSIAPFDEDDQIDFYIVNVRAEDKFGQFVFPRSVLMKRGIISTKNKEGKRAFRVYSNWDVPKSKQAINTQKWQLNYFYEIEKTVDFRKVNKLFRST